MKSIFSVFAFFVFGFAVTNEIHLNPISGLHLGILETFSVSIVYYAFEIICALCKVKISKLDKSILITLFICFFVISLVEHYQNSVISIDFFKELLAFLIIEFVLIKVLDIISK